MSRILFSEQQKFNQIWLYAIIIISTLVAIIPLGHGFFTQIINGEPWGQNPMSDIGLLTLVIVTLIALIAINYVVFTARLEVEIKDNSIYYKYFPMVWNWKTLFKDYIQSYEIRKISPISDLGGYGYRKRFFKKTTGLVVSGDRALVLTLTDGKTLIIGTQKPNELGNAMKLLMNESLRE